MARNQYAKDYRLIETVDERGHIHIDYEYIGVPYSFVQSPEQVRRELRLRGVLCLLGWCWFLLAMLPNSQAMRTWYVSLPFVFTALPLWQGSSAVLSLLRAPQPMERRFADRLENRFPPAALAMMLLPGGATVLELVSWAAGRNRSAPDGAFALCAVLCAVCGACCFARRGRLTLHRGA